MNREERIVVEVTGNRWCAGVAAVDAWRALPNYLGRDGAALLRRCLDDAAEREDARQANRLIDDNLRVAWVTRDAAHRHAEADFHRLAEWAQRNAANEAKRRANDDLLRTAGFDPASLSGKARKRALARSAA
jgi:hypothetical protein